MDLSVVTWLLSVAAVAITIIFFFEGFHRRLKAGSPKPWALLKFACAGLLCSIALVIFLFSVQPTQKLRVVDLSSEKTNEAFSDLKDSSAERTETAKAKAKDSRPPALAAQDETSTSKEIDDYINNAVDTWRGR